MMSEDVKPINPLIEKWKVLYPPVREGKECNYIKGYTYDGVPFINPACAICNSKCYHNRKFEIPDEDLEIWLNYQRKLEEYFNVEESKKYVKKITR